MKNKLTVIVSVAMTLLMILSVLTACSFGKKGEESESSTTLSPDEEWYPGANETYEPVEIETVELAAIVSEALGDEAAGFTGNLNSLTSEQLQKVRQVAESKGYVVETDTQGDTVIKKDSSIKVTGASSEKTSEILSRAGVENTTALSNEQYKEISKAAEEKGATAVTDSRGNVTIVETTIVPTSARASTTSQSGTPSSAAGTTAGRTTTAPITSRDISRTADRNPSPNTSASYTTVTTTKTYKFTNITNSAANTYGNKSNSIFVSNAAVSGGVVSVGNTGTSDSEDSYAVSNALIVKHNQKGKKDWSDVLSADDRTVYEDVAVLADGSIIAVGETMAENITNDAGYKCKGTVEGVIVKYTAKGHREWLKLFGGSGGDIIYAVAPTSDGGFVIGGKTESADFDLKNTGNDKIKAYLAKMDANGNLQWVQALSASKHCTVKDIAVTSSDTIYAVIESIAKDGDFANLAAAANGKKYSLVEKLDINGKLLWTKDFYESGQTNLTAITAANDNGCVVAGSYSSGKGGNTGSFKSLYNGGTSGTFDGIIVKINTIGDLTWELPLVGFQSDYITGIAAVKGGYAVTGYTTSTNRDFTVTNQGDYDSFVAAVSEHGKLMLMKSLGGTESDRAMCLCSDGDSTVYSCGSTYSSDVDFAGGDAKSTGENAVAFIYKYDLTTE